MSDFAKFCPKCYAFFRDPDLYAKHVEACGFARDKTADSRRQTAAEEKKVRKRQTTEKTADGRQQFAADASDEEIPPESAAVCGLPSAVSAEGGTTKTKFKT